MTSRVLLFLFIWCFDIIIASLSQDKVSMPPPPQASSDGVQRSGASQRDQFAKTGVACRLAMLFEI